MRNDARLEELGGGLYAWLQPDGSWGLSNAGLVSNGESSLLVDTLYDLPLTQRMLDAMADAAPDIALGDYSAWLDSERIVVNVSTLYREFGYTGEALGSMETFSLMAELAR